MLLQSVNPLWIKLVKILSPVVMLVALGVNGMIAYDWQQGLGVPKVYQVLGAMGSVALLVHFVESVVAAIIALRQGLNPLRYGIYTFLVGTVAFLDLMKTDA